MLQDDQKELFTGFTVNDFNLSAASLKGSPQSLFWRLKAAVKVTATEASKKTEKQEEKKEAAAPLTLQKLPTSKQQKSSA